VAPHVVDNCPENMSYQQPHERFQREVFVEQDRRLFFGQNSIYSNTFHVQQKLYNNAANASKATSFAGE